jgi:hypothetical protein
MDNSTVAPVTPKLSPKHKAHQKMLSLHKQRSHAGAYLFSAHVSGITHFLTPHVRVMRQG